jgi:hypothetical protein
MVENCRDRFTANGRRLETPTFDRLDKEGCQVRINADKLLHVADASVPFDPQPQLGYPSEAPFNEHVKVRYWPCNGFRRRDRITGLDLNWLGKVRLLRGRRARARRK